MIAADGVKGAHRTRQIGPINLARGKGSDRQSGLGGEDVAVAAQTRRRSCRQGAVPEGRGAAVQTAESAGVRRRRINRPLARGGKRRRARLVDEVAVGGKDDDATACDPRGAERQGSSGGADQDVAGAGVDAARHRQPTLINERKAVRRKDVEIANTVDGRRQIGGPA